jgi:predicted transcriptional regulator of viral defense system
VFVWGTICPIQIHNVKFLQWACLTICERRGEYMPYSDTERKMDTNDFFATHPVFQIDEASQNFLHRIDRSKAVERLKHHLEKGRLKLVTRGVYAVIPPGISGGGFEPDPFLISIAVRPDAVFSHHSALELLGAAHSIWNHLTVYTKKRRRPLALPGNVIRFREYPHFRNWTNTEELGIQSVERQGKILKTTGPERTLVEGFRQSALAGGLEELIQSARGFPTLDIVLLMKVLDSYEISNLWAAVGWFLEIFQKTFHVTENQLGVFKQKTPRSPQYLERNQRGGRLVSGWNLILPEGLKNIGAPDEH